MSRTAANTRKEKEARKCFLLKTPERPWPCQHLEWTHRFRNCETTDFGDFRPCPLWSFVIVALETYAPTNAYPLSTLLLESVMISERFKNPFKSENPAIMIHFLSYSHRLYQQSMTETHFHKHPQVQIKSWWFIEL